MPMIETTSYPVSIEEEEGVFYQNDRADGVYQIENGIIEISLHSREGDKTIIDLAIPGEFVGPEPVIGRSRRFACARALTPCELTKYSSREALEYLKTSQNFYEIISDMYMSYLDLIDRCESVVTQNLRERIVCQLCKLAKKFGKETGGGIELDVRLYRKTLANMLGCRVETVIRELKKLEREGLLKTERSRITIRLPDDFFRIPAEKCNDCLLEPV